MQLSYLIGIASDVQGHILYPLLSLSLTLTLALPLLLALSLALPIPALWIHPAIDPHVRRPTVPTLLRTHHLGTLLVPLILLLVHIG